MKIAFTVCSANYLPFAKSLADSLIQHNPAYKFVIVLADTYKGYDSHFFAPHEVLPVREMSIPYFEEMNSRYNIFELSCALKPFVAHYLLEAKKDCDALFYFDSDILLYGPLTKAETILQDHCLVVTPHVAKPLDYEAGIFTELNVLRTGLYNAGFFGINRSTESFKFLKWWKVRLRYYCFNDATHGLFVDQLWLDLAPLYFRTTYILYNPGYNLAYWNFSERRLTVINEKFIVNENHPLIFFHYSGYNIEQPQAISTHQKQYSFQSVPEYLPLFEKYRAIAHCNDVADFFSLPVTLGKPPPVKPVREKNFFKRKYKKLFKKQ